MKPRTIPAFQHCECLAKLVTEFLNPSLKSSITYRLAGGTLYKVARMTFGAQGKEGSRFVLVKLVKANRRATCDRFARGLWLKSEPVVYSPLKVARCCTLTSGRCYSAGDEPVRFTNQESFFRHSKIVKLHWTFGDGYSFCQPCSNREKKKTTYRGWCHCR